ncbi:MAG: hypothetical protein IJI84_04355 [Clostridia bacterium]|nr:hypothetical protein [Clostridia bacterium]
MNKKVLKLMSLILAVLSLSSSLNMSLYGLDNSTVKSEDSSVSSKSNEEGTWDKIKDHLKNNVALYSVSAAATITTTLLLLMNNTSKRRYHSLSDEYWDLRCDYTTLLSTYDNYSTVSVPVPYVPADVWFERLGGTQNDIDSYVPYDYDAVPYVPTSNELNTRKYKQIYQISFDVNRYPPEAFMRNSQSEDFKIKFNHILDKFYTEHDNIDYTQGWDYILYMIYRKFMFTRNTTQLLPQQDEAKVYFIYSKFMEMIGGKYNNSDWQKNADDLAKSFFNNRFSHNKEFERIMFSTSDMAPHNRQMIFLHGVFMGGTQLLGFRKATLIWDYIILNNNFVSPQGFNPKTLDEVNNIMLAYIDLHFHDLKKSLFPNGVYTKRLSIF